MNNRIGSGGRAHIFTTSVILLAFGGMAIVLPGWAIPAESDPEPTAKSRKPPTHMSETLRSSVKKIVVLPTTAPTNQGIGGSYQKQTPGLVGGAQSGSRLGDGVSKDIGGVRFNFPIPILTLPGALFGGAKGKTQQAIQDFRDALTADLAQAASHPLTNDALASDVFWNLRNVPGLDSKVFSLTTPIPADTDAILYVSLTDVTIDVDGSDAVVTTSASAAVRRVSDGSEIHSSVVHYQDRDTLKNWTENDNALWRDYANYARHYIGREVSAEAFERVALRRELRPIETGSVKRIKKNNWQGTSKSGTPTIAWELKLLGDDSYGSWANGLSEADISYDIEIYDMHQLVYAAKNIPDPFHAVDAELEACKTFRWSVRPSYHVGSDTKFGEWMRFNPDANDGNGNVGRKVSVAPAYIQDFASLDIDCRRK